jgi:hypothetical protein
MINRLTLSAAAILLCCGSAMAVTVHHHHVRHHVMSSNGGHSRNVFYGVGNGGETPRTTATGGNAGGYSNKN